MALAQAAARLGLPMRRPVSPSGRALMEEFAQVTLAPPRSRRAASPAASAARSTFLRAAHIASDAQVLL